MGASLLIAAATMLTAGFAPLQDKPLTVPKGPQHVEYSTYHYTGQDRVDVFTKGDLVFSIEDGGAAPPSEELTLFCFSPCKGKKHPDHSKCDKSCDAACTYGKHSGRSVVELNPDTLDLRKDPHHEPVPPNLIPIADTDIKSLTKSIIATQGYQSLERSAPGHWARPCSTTTRKYGYKRFNLRAKGLMTQSFKMPSDSWTITADIDAIVAFIDLPDYTKTRSETNVVSCYCTSLYSEIDPPTETITPGTNTGPGIVWNPPFSDGWFPDPNDPGPGPSPGISFGGNDLNKIDIGIGQLPPEGFQIFLPPGQIFIPDDSDVQAMVSLVGTLLKVPGKLEALQWLYFHPEHINASAPDQSMIPLGTVRVACTEMRKHEPNSKVKFKPSSTFDPVLVNIAKVADGERFRGPWDQARVWIYTDNATLEEVNKILLPGPNVGSYVRALQQAEECGVDLIKGAAKRCLTPDLVLGSTAPPTVIGWLLDRLSSANPKGTAAFIKSNFAKIAQEGKPEDKTSIGYLAALVDGLATSTASDLRSLLPDFIAKAIPAGMKEDVLNMTRFEANFQRAINKHKPPVRTN